jgi:uncharacterized protein DUF4159
MNPIRRNARLVTSGAIAMMVAATLVAQREVHDLDGGAPAVYDGRFAFARLTFVTGPGGYYYGGLPAWAHGYPRAERNLMRIVDELTLLRPHTEESRILALDDPDLCRYPIAYMTESGFWTLTNREAAAFRGYLLKGGFVIFDDFRDPFRGGGGWNNFESNMRRVLPLGSSTSIRRIPSSIHFSRSTHSTSSRRTTTAAARSSEGSSRTTILANGCWRW